jgi:hypothetical protein
MRTLNSERDQPLCTKVLAEPRSDSTSQVADTPKESTKLKLEVKRKSKTKKGAAETELAARRESGPVFEDYIVDEIIEK